MATKKEAYVSDFGSIFFLPRKFFILFYLIAYCRGNAFHRNICEPEKIAVPLNVSF